MRMLRWRLLWPAMMLCLVPCQGTFQLYSSPVMAPSSRVDAMSQEAIIRDFNYSAVANLYPLQEAARTTSDNRVELHLPQANGRIATITGTVDSMYKIPESPGTYRMSGSAPWGSTASATFSFYVDTVKQLVMGDLVADDNNWYRFETDDKIRVNRIPRESAICVLGDTPVERTRQLTIEKKGDQGETHASSSSAHHRRHLHNRHNHGHHHHKREDRELAHGPKEGQLDTLHKAGGAALSSGHTDRALQTTQPFLIFLDAAVEEVGQYGPWTSVNSLFTCGSPNAAQLEILMAIVREDFAPFDVTVTSNRTVYSAWTTYKVRVGLIRSVMASDVRIGGNVCGAAYLGKYRVADNLVWVVLCDGSCTVSNEIIATTISHEVGHAFDLQHDGSSSDGIYFEGLPSPPTTFPPGRRWNTIMGISGTFGMTQWSRGEYPGYSSTQGNPDDIQIIRDAVGQRSNAFCNERFALQNVSSSNPYLPSESAISCGGGTHEHMVAFDTGGRIGVQVATSSETNLKFEVAVFSGTGGTVETFVPSTLAIARGTNNAYDSTTVTLNSNVAAGLYLIRIRSVAQTTNTITAGAAFPVYGSVGFYTLTVTSPSGTPGPTSPPDSTPEPSGTPSPAPTLAGAPTVSPVTSACLQRVCGCGKVGTNARVCRPQLRLTMRLLPPSIRAGETTKLILTVRNTGADSLPLVSVNLNLASTLTLQSADSGVTFEGNTVLLPANMPARSVRSYSVRILVSSTVAVGSRHLIEGVSSTYGVRSIPTAKQTVRIRK